MHMNSQNYMCTFFLSSDLLRQVKIANECPHISDLICKYRIICNSDKQAQTFRSNLYMQILFLSVRPTRLPVQPF
jgi:hypothetical protein